MFSQLFNRSTAIFRNAFGYRPTARFFATRSPFPCIVCQFRIVSTEGSPQLCVPDVCPTRTLCSGNSVGHWQDRNGEFSDCLPSESPFIFSAHFLHTDRRTTS